MSHPIVSVVMSAHNEEDYLKDTIESILSQTYNDFEFIIVNDGSTDNTPEILSDYAGRDSRIRVISNMSNVGLSRALNKGLEVANGRYIARMDAGDISHPTRFQKQVEFLEANHDICILGTCAYWIDEIGQVVGKWHVPTNVTSAVLYKTAAVIHPSIMTSRQLFEVLGGYNKKYRRAQDFELYLRTMKMHVSIINLSEFLISVMRRDKGIQFAHITDKQLHIFRIKLRYLLSFPSIPNAVFTMRSLVGCMLPPRLLREQADAIASRQTSERQ